MRSIPRRAFAILSTSIVLSVVLVLPAVAQTDDVEQAAREVLDRYSERSLAEAWQGARALEALGDDAIPWCWGATTARLTTKTRSDVRST